MEVPWHLYLVLNVILIFLIRHQAVHNAVLRELSKPRSPLRRTQYVLKHLVDLYFGLMVLGWSLDFISKDMAFVQYNVKIAQFTLYPWFVVPIVIAVATRPFLSSILYLAVIVTFIAFAVGPEYVTFFE